MPSYPSTPLRLIATLTMNSAAAASTTAGTAPADVDFSMYDDLLFECIEIGGTGGTIDLYVQDSADNVTFWDYGHFTQVAAATTARYRESPALTGTPVLVGTGTTPLITAGTFSGSRWLPYMRLCATAGAGTSAGAAQTVYVYGRRR